MINNNIFVLHTTEIELLKPNTLVVLKGFFLETNKLYLSPPTALSRARSTRMTSLSLSWTTLPSWRRRRRGPPAWTSWPSGAKSWWGSAYRKEKYVKTIEMWQNEHFRTRAPAGFAVNRLVGRFLQHFVAAWKISSAAVVVYIQQGKISWRKFPSFFTCGKADRS